MKKQSVRKQAVILTCFHALTRALGFILRVLLSRLMGAEAVGVMELSHSAHMLSITPVTAGLPLAVSRMTARDKSDLPLRAGRQLAWRISLCLLPVWLLLAPVLSYLLHDLRVLPSLLLFAPCIPILGLSAIYNGYCYGSGNVFPPALSEIVEQLLRFSLSAALHLLLPQLTIAYRAAVPALATAIAEAAGLLLVICLLRRPRAAAGNLLPAQREILRLSLPLMLSRLLTTMLRTASGALIPLRLIASGLDRASAMEAFGMLQGMVMPLIFLPGIVTGALGTVGTSAIAERSGLQRRRMAILLFLSALICGCAGAVFLRAFADLLAQHIFNLPALAPLLRAAAPLTLFFALQHAVNGVMSGLGLQKQLLLPSLMSAVISLACLYFWAAEPQLRILGAIRAMVVAQAAGVLWGLWLAARRGEGRSRDGF